MDAWIEVQRRSLRRRNVQGRSRLRKMHDRQMLREKCNLGARPLLSEIILMEAQLREVGLVSN